MNQGERVDSALRLDTDYLDALDKVKSGQAKRMKMPDEVAATLGSYVYVYIDPRDGKPFYIGKGVGSRCFAHLEDKTESEKVQRIAEIRAAGKEPLIDLLRYGLTDREAALVEAAAIDLIGKENLTNKVVGFHKGTFGRITSDEVITMLAAKPVKIQHDVILITINQKYRSGIPKVELYEATRGLWKVGKKNRERVDYAMAVYQGIVREVYRIERWLPAGTLDYHTRDDIERRKDSGRWEFEGEVAHDLHDMYVGHRVGKGGQNPIRYVFGASGDGEVVEAGA